MENKRFEYEFNLSDWHLNNIGTIIKSYILNSYSVGVHVDELKSIAEELLIFLKEKYSSILRVNIDISSNLFGIFVKFNFTDEANQEAQIIQKTEIIDLCKERSINTNHIEINDAHNSLTFKLGKQLPLHIVSSISSISLHAILLIIFITSMILKVGTIKLSIIGIIWIIASVGANRLLNLLIRKKEDINFRLLRDKIVLNKNLSLQYDNLISQFKAKSHSKRSSSYLQMLGQLDEELKSKIQGVKNLIQDEIGYINNCKELIKIIKLKDDETIDIISNTNKKLENKKTSLTNLLQSTSKKIDGEVNLSHNLTKKIKKSVEILKNSLEISSVLQKNSDYLVLFMKTIEDISTKIHILSMNASITAARLGDAGKPFMVVAKEVRKLSEEVSSSVKEMSDYSKSLQSSITEVKDLTNSVFTEIDSTYTDINTIIQNFEGFYLSLTVMNKMIYSNMKENSQFFNDISSIIATYSDNNSSIEQNLNSINYDRIYEFISFLNETFKKILEEQT